MASPATRTSLNPRDPTLGNGAHPAPAEVRLTPFLGTWVNTDRASGGITGFVLACDASGHSIRVQTGREAGSWQTTPVVPYSAGMGSTAADGFRAGYGNDSESVELVAYFTKGLIVLSHYHLFTDGGARPNYFVREFYFRESPETRETVR